MKIRSKIEFKASRNTFSSFSHKKTVKSRKRRKILSRHPFWDTQDISGLKTCKSSFFGIFSSSYSWMFRNLFTGLRGAETVGNIMTYIRPLSIFVMKKYAFSQFFDINAPKTSKICTHGP